MAEVALGQQRRQRGFPGDRGSVKRDKLLTFPVHSPPWRAHTLISALPWPSGTPVGSPAFPVQAVYPHLSSAVSQPKQSQSCCCTGATWWSLKVSGRTVVAIAGEWDFMGVQGQHTTVCPCTLPASLLLSLLSWGFFPPLFILALLSHHFPLLSLSPFPLYLSLQLFFNSSALLLVLAVWMWVGMMSLAGEPCP